MIRRGRFVMSHRPYAIDPDSLFVREETRNDDTTYWYARVRAVWFRRRNGITTANVGYLWDYLDQSPTDALDYAATVTDGRYGGTTLGRWDGSGYWGSESPDTMNTHLELLRPMLDQFPAIPDGFNVWWTFKGAAK